MIEVIVEGCCIKEEFFDVIYGTIPTGCILNEDNRFIITNEFLNEFTKIALEYDLKFRISKI